MTLALWQATPPPFTDELAVVYAALRNDAYRRMGSIPFTNHLELTVRNLQRYDGTTPGELLLDLWGARSVSVGDLFVQDDPQTGPRYFLVARAGFRELYRIRQIQDTRQQRPRLIVTPASVTQTLPPLDRYGRIRS